MAADVIRENYRSRMIKQLLNDEAGVKRNIAQALQQGAFSRQECQATIKETKQLIHRISRGEQYADLLAYLASIDKFTRSDN